MYKVIYKKEYEKDGETKTYWPTVGRGFDAKNGLVLRIDAIPTNWDGSLYIVEDKPKEDTQTQSKGSWEQQREKFAKKDEVATDVPSQEDIDAEILNIPF